MATLTIRLDEKIEGLLNHFAEVNNQTKSDIARTGLLEYLNQQKQLEDEKKQLESDFTVTDKSQVKNRIQESEASYQLSDQEYEQEMDDFFARELGLVR